MRRRHERDQRTTVLPGGLPTDTAPDSFGMMTITSLFVYGTLRPGDARWPILEPFVTDEGIDDSVGGSLYDTGLDYPAAIFDDGGTIRGRTYGLRIDAVERALEVLDRVEGTVGGRYHRVVVTTGQGMTAWAYQYGDGLDLTKIDSGDWFDR